MLANKFPILDRFISEEEALALPLQLPPKGNHLYYTLIDGMPHLAVGVIRDLETEHQSAKYAESLMQMPELMGKVKKGLMKGTMHAFGFRRGMNALFTVIILLLSSS